MSYEVLTPAPFRDSHGFYWKNAHRVFSFDTLEKAKAYATEEGGEVVENFWDKCPIAIDTPKNHPLHPKKKKKGGEK